MRVIITGGTGLIGRALVTKLTEKNHEVIILTRSPERAAQMFRRQGPGSVECIGWNGRSAQGWGELVTRDSAIVNLAGATPAHWRWTQAYKQHILHSRLQAGEAIMQAIAEYEKPAVLIQASASGYYGDRGQEVLTEASAAGQGFRADVCQHWEASIAKVRTRRCIIRTGLVLDPHEGVFPPLLHFVSLMGSQIGKGEQWIPWIHKADVASAILFLLEQKELSGPFNLCSSEAVTNRDFLQAIHQLLKRPAIFPLPAWVLQILLGELASVVLDSQRLFPQRLLKAGFQFKYPKLEQTLQQLLEADYR